MSAIYTLSCASDDGSALELDFRKQGDRYVQSIRRVTSDGTWLDRWIAVQEDEPVPWPASPPVQELHLQTIEGQDVLLGVGRAGKCHWSLSIETAEIDSVAALRFDFACRCPEPPGWLGSSYRRDEQDSPADAGQIAAALVIRCEEDARLSGDDDKLCIEPIGAPAQWPGTVRWRYAILAR